jgi:hypothetical protein
MRPSARRMRLYLSKTYQPWITLPYAVLSYLALSWSLAAGRGREPGFGSGEAAGILTTFFFLLFLRVSDEIKDAESDKRLFPERLLPSGRIVMADLRCLWWIALASLAASSLLSWPPSPWSAALIAYSLLMYKYFFAPRAISGNLLLALATHNPSMYLLQLCALGFASPRTAPSAPDFAVCLLFYLPSLLWELSRKVRPPSRETEYRTYSSIFGYRLAAALAFLPAALMLALAAALSGRIGLPGPALAAIGAALLPHAARTALFIARPEKRLPGLAMTAQAFGLAFYAIVAVNAVLGAYAAAHG